MAREFSKTNLTIWQDPEWRALPWPAQHVYKMFWEHPSLSYCGIADWRPSKMLGWGSGWERSAFEALTDCLRARHFLVVDEDTEEVLVRSWIRFDGLIRQPRLAVSLTKAFAEVGSNTLRGIVVDELCKLHDREPDAEGWKKPSVLSLLDLPRVSAKDESVPEDPFGTGFVISFGSVSEAFRGNVTSGFGSVSDPPTTSTSTSTLQQQHVRDSADAERVPDRLDVNRLCAHLADSVAERGIKRPTITKAWRDAARLLLDKDGYTEQQIDWLIDHSANDGFWRKNILSMPTLREKADRLKLEFAPQVNAGDAPGIRYLPNGDVDPASLPPVEDDRGMKMRPRR